MNLEMLNERLRDMGARKDQLRSPVVQWMLEIFAGMDEQGKEAIEALHDVIDGKDEEYRQKEKEISRRQEKLREREIDITRNLERIGLLQQDLEKRENALDIAMQEMREMETAEARDSIRLYVLFNEALDAVMKSDPEHRKVHPTAYAQGLGNIFRGKVL